MAWTGWIMVGAVAASMWLVPAEARAGGCPECTTSADCPDGFCVYWDAGHGCASVNPICCPGQGCVVEDGRPSCEADGLCCVVEDAECVMPPGTSSGSDSSSGDASADGSTDASADDSSSDASASDASASDASASDASASDTGGGTVDGGDGGDGTDTAGDDDDEGCGCTSAPDEDRLAWLLAAFAGMLTTRRQRLG